MAARLTKMAPDKISLSLPEATDLIQTALEAVGTEPAIATSVAKALVAAEAEGQVGHGFSRLADYAAQVRSGKVDGRAQPVCTFQGEAALRIDAQNGFAYPALDLAIAEGCAAAQRVGCASMAINRSHHCGALSVQVARIAERGLIGLMVANAPAAIAPWGGREAVFGTNPIAFAAPRAEGPPLVIDLSLSKVARGKIMNAKKLGQPIPEGWAVDASGAPTTDPDAALGGTMLPMGDAKGTALALMVEILSAVIPGAHPSREVGSFFAADGPPTGAGQFLMALAPADVTQFTARLEPILTFIDAMEGARLPGARREKALRTAQAEGIQVPTDYITHARALAGSPG